MNTQTSQGGGAAAGKRRKVRRNVTLAVVHVKATFNNTVVTVTDTKGDVLCWASAGTSGFNAVVDLPLAIPTLVTGVMLVVLYGPQQALGAWLKEQWDFQIIFAPPGIILALLFITFPFVVRAVEPVLASLDRTQEDAAASLGAGAWTIFRRITLPPLLLPLASGALLSFARAIGEFGAIVIVAGNIPLRSQTAAVYVLGEVESENRLGASAISIVMVTIAFGLLLFVDWLQRRGQKENQ